MTADNGGEKCVENFRKITFRKIKHKNNKVTNDKVNNKATIEDLSRELVLQTCFHSIGQITLCF